MISFRLPNRVHQSSQGGRLLGGNTWGARERKVIPQQSLTKLPAQVKTRKSSRPADTQQNNPARNRPSTIPPGEGRRAPPAGRSEARKKPPIAADVTSRLRKNSPSTNANATKPRRIKSTHQPRLLAREKQQHEGTYTTAQIAMNREHRFKVSGCPGKKTSTRKCCHNHHHADHKPL